jgi:hypothetical protein
VAEPVNKRTHQEKKNVYNRNIVSSKNQLKHAFSLLILNESQRLSILKLLYDFFKMAHMA